MIGYRVKSNFFDREKIIKSVDRARRKNLSKSGAFIRRAARSSIRPGGKSGIVSKPGEPPRSHSGELKRKIFFAYEPLNDGVVVGPVGFGRSKAPSLLEYGGSVQVRDQLVRVGPRRLGRNEKPRFVRYTGRMRYKPRPFMGPAFEKAKKDLDEIWGNSVKG